MRKPPATHGKTLRGFSVFNDVVVYHESDLERRVSKVLQLRKDVRAIYSQFPVLLYRDADGVWREHICDFCVVFNDGEIVAVAVKHVHKSDVMTDLLERIKAEGFLRKNKNGTTTPNAVNDICLMTEREATYGAFENAERIMRARRMRDDAEFDRAHEAAQKFRGRFRFGELLRNCDDRATRRTALLLLIDEGVLLTETPGRIDDLTMLMVRR
ncbi:hypothetical protein G6K93_15985 [Agrobacterium rhizogenes]|uniref:hypothetical protein n=1 Tax=Rhizobium rhizogenes TaxID=359 RepID=UPI00115E51A6|nr:hypothetical protein [Rhizobium rhizogenes]NTI88500.1 hypothetical protein [Rhizobium rhizogenes]NTJ48511.1 hypothetical protein [Rhizobium rhizogenes]TRB25580.1 hypothetical protein EXN70_00125 [Rhizobium rhizogenes]